MLNSELEKIQGSFLRNLKHRLSIRGLVVAIYSVLLLLIVTSLYLLIFSQWSSTRSAARDVPASEKKIIANTGSRTSGVSTIKWETPKPNWLYVLDYINLTDADNGQVLLIDPQGQVHGKIITGNIPDMVLSPDGTRLYLASISQSGDMLSVIETSSGRVLQTTPVNDRWVYTIMPELSSMAISPDGRWLYMVMLRNNMDSVAAFDTTKGVFLPEEASIPACLTGVLLTHPAKPQLQVLCSGTNDVRFLQLQENSLEAIGNLPPLTLLHEDDERLKVSTGKTSLKGNTYAVLGDGRVVEIDGNTGGIARLVVSQPLADGYIPAREVLLSPDGTKLYIARGDLSRKSTGQANQILVIDTTSGKKLKTITTSRPFWNLVLNHDGSALYAVSSKTQSLILIDAASYQEMRIIENIGQSPTRALVTP